MTREQDTVIDGMAIRHGGVQVAPPTDPGDTSVAVCGWDACGTECGGRPLTPWVRVSEDGRVERVPRAVAVAA